MAVLHLTESHIRDLDLGSGIWRDNEVKGLLVVCHATTKTYAAQGDVRRNGRHIRTVRVKIDRVDRISLREARNRARAIMSQIQSGVDPTAGPKESGITLLQALDEHLQEKPFRDATVESYRYNIEHYLGRYKNRAVADLSRSEVRDIYQHLRSAKGQPTATGVMRTLRAVINTALRLDETLTSNPVTFLRLPTPKSRHVDELDVAEWWEKTEALSPIRRDLHRAMLLTGARRASILGVKRKDVNLVRGVLIFNHMKTGGRMLFPMGTFLRDMIAQRLEDDLPFNNPWLWPSPASGKGCATEPKERKRGLPFPGKAKAEVILRGPPYVTPLSITPISRVQFANGGRRPIEVIGIPASQAFQLFLKEGDVERRARDLLHLLIERHGDLLAGVAAARTKGTEFLKDFDPKAGLRRNALRSATWIGALLHHLDRLKEVYMSDAGFRLGQLLAAADIVHVGYCKDVRDGSIPPTLLGNALLGMAAERPHDALKLLLKRWPPYAAWAKRKARWVLREIEPIAMDLRERLGKVEGRPDEYFQAELLLGYMAGLPRGTEGAGDTSHAEGQNDVNRGESA